MEAVRTVRVKDEAGHYSFLRLIHPIMSKEDLLKAERNRNESSHSYPDVRQETEQSKLQGRLLRRTRIMAEKKQQKAEAKAKAKKETYNDPNKPPAVPKGKKAVWHKEYTYKNAKDTTITVKGHWEIINASAEKPKKEEPKAETIEVEAESESEPESE
jgi:hypothetical protein